MRRPFATGTWDPARETPYVHWRRTRQTVDWLRDDRIAFAAAPAAFSEIFQPYGIPPSAVEQATRPLGGDSQNMPMPREVVNPKAAEIESFVPADLVARMARKLPKDAVITAIVDEGIALGNPRFRDAGGHSRVLAAWHQGASFDAAQEAFLPFGHELHQAEIDALLRRHSLGGDLRAALDDTAFNRAAKICEPQAMHGECTAERHASHGTATLDLAAGLDAGATDADALARRPIIAVGLPNRRTIGMAGTYLEYFAIYAMHRIVAIADALWQAWYGPEGGFPIVLNVSYGQQAGPKDGNSPFEREIRKLQADRPAGAPLDVVMPVGNDNLMRCHARRHLKVKKSNKMWEDWRIQPADQSSNFAEIWSAAQAGLWDTHALKIAVTSPFGEAMAPWRGKHGQFREIGGGARIYCQRIAYNGPEAVSYRFRYVICVPPTEGALAPAGLWHISLTKPKIKGEVYMQVQIDQSPEPGSRNSRRSYFDNPDYRTHLPNGRLRDSYAYPLIDPDNPKTSNQEDFRFARNVQRKGTISSIAVLDTIVSVGSFRAADGAPSLFSATSYWGKRAPVDDPRMVAALPGEVSAMRPALRAAGTRAGSSVWVRGTSFSTALATRHIVEAMLAGVAMPGGAAAWMRAQAAASEGEMAARLGHAHETRRGHGRLAVTHEV